MSRTCARQQRMRQQTLNEERMSHTEEAVRPSSERRSSGSKLIISSPTPTAYPFMNHATPVSQSTPLSDPNSMRNVSQPVRGVGASALLAFLNGSDHRASSQTTNSNSSQQQQTRSTTQSKPGSPHLPNVLVSSRLGQPDGNAVLIASTNSCVSQGFSGDPTQSVAVHTGTGAANERQIHSSSKVRDSSGLLLDTVRHPTDTTVAISTRTSDPGPPPTSVALPVDISTMDLESTVSPASSDLNSPMEPCFPNIAEDQESDSFDLNNITPSIHLSSSFGVPGEFLTGYPRSQTGALVSGSTDCGDRIISRSSFTDSSSGLEIRLAHLPELRNLPAGNLNQSNHVTLHAHLTPLSSQQANLTRRGLVAKTEEDDLSLSKASSSCPAEMQEALNGLGSSPIQLNMSTGYTTQSGSGNGGSGGSLGGTSTNEGIPTAQGGGSASVLYASPNSLARSSDDQRAAAWARDRTKKDSHNRIERKRRDYINCQISELGNLLPEDMFRDGDCKKNKGSILKNSVEFICLLRSELAQVHDVRKETMLAAKVITQLRNRIQELETVSGTTQSNVDYQSTLREWLQLHEHNLQNRTILSPSAKSSFVCRTEVAGCGNSSLGLSSLATEEMLTESKTAFSSRSLLAGSAPSAPLTVCSRLHSPVSGVSNNSRLSGAVESPLRMMRTRCTSLTVASTGALDPAIIRLPNAELTQVQQHQLLQSQQVHQQPQRLIPGQPLRGVPTTSAPLHLSSDSNNATNQSGQLRGSSFLHTHNRQWQQTLTDGTGRITNQLSSPHQVLPPQHRRSHVTRPLDLLQTSTDQDMACSGLSASLPVHVNPLLCGLPDRDEGKPGDGRLPHVYSFERDEFLTHLKPEPLSEADSSRASELGYTDGGRSSTDLALTDPGPTPQGVTNGSLCTSGQPPQSQSTVGGTSATVTTVGTTNYISDMALDSPTHLAFETDDFRFDDVPME